MKKILFLFTFLCCFCQSAIAQITAGGVLDNALDRKGNVYTLTSMAVNDTVRSDSGYVVNNVVPTVTSGYFKLFLEPGCGMDDISNPTQLARLNVICSLCADLSNFIQSPLTTTGNKVNVWVRNPANVTGYPFMAYATSFYNLPAGAAVGGIADNVAWTTINSGYDAYKNVAPTAWLASGSANTCFHIVTAFDFSSYTWNTNLASTPASSEYDMYTIALGEFAHALGLHSLIAIDGSSLLGASYPWYSRYDLKLKSYSGVPLLTHTGSTPMIGYSFNSALTPLNILSPFPGACMTDTSRCDTTVQYVGGATVPVYTPNCFEPGTSLSCFEDICYFAPSSMNNQYFTASNITNTGSMKRYLSKEERLALGDIGLSVGTTYGDASRLNAYTYSGGALVGVNVIGGNDGIGIGGGVSYMSDTVTPDSTGAVIINGPGLGPVTPGLLANDVNADAFEGLTVLNGTGTFTATSGTATTAITYTPGAFDASGLKVISYVPYNTSTGLRGNVTTATIKTTVYIGCTLPAITCSTTRIALGGTTTMSNTSTGGAWSIGAASAPYATISGSTTANPVTILGISPGNATITYTVGACRVFYTIVVLPNCLSALWEYPSTSISLVGSGGTFSAADIANLGSTTTCKYFFTNTDIVIASGTVTIRNSMIAIRPGSKITVMPGAKLIIEGSHLFCCDSMWQGLKLSGTAQLEIYGGSTGVSSLIEDAYTAVTFAGPSAPASYLPVVTASPGTANRLNLYCQNAIFNKNNVGIAVSGYTAGAAAIVNISENNAVPSYPYYISGSVFTSRGLNAYPAVGPCSPFGWPYNWPNVRGGTLGLEDPIAVGLYDPPYQITTAYAYSLCNDLSMATTGIKLKDVGSSMNSLASSVYWGISVGNPLNLTGELTLFDTLAYGIDDTTSNLTARGCAFIKISKVGISDYSTSINHTYNYRLNVYGALGSGTYSNNLFYNCATGVKTIDVYEIRSKYANMFSLQSTGNPTGTQGAYGFDMTGFSYYNIEMHNDSLYNIRNGFVHTTYLLSGTANLYGQICISKNLIAATYGGTTPTNQFVKNGVILTGYAGYSAWALGGAQVNVDSNTIQNAYNGIKMTLLNSGAQKVTAEYNTITLRKDATVTTAIQAGIYEVSNRNSYIDYNTISGPGLNIPVMPTGIFTYSSLTSRIEAIHVANAVTCSLQCNNTSKTNVGFYFGSTTNSAVYWVGNAMSTHFIGMALDGSIGAQPGVPLQTTGNSWTGPMTHATRVASPSSGASSVMSVNTVPANNVPGPNTADAGGTAYVIGGSCLPYSAGYTTATCFAAPARSVIAYRMANSTPNLSVPFAAVKQKLAFPEDGFQHAKQWIAQKLTYDQLIQEPQLADNDPALSKFMSLAANSRFKYVDDMMGNLGHSNPTLEANVEALTNTTTDEVTGVKMADGADVDFIIRNYVQYAHLYKAYVDGNFNERDQEQLSILAHKCPNTEGAAVYNARALYGVVTSDYSIIGNGACDSQALYTNGPDNTFHVAQGYDLFPNPNNGKITLVQHLAESQLVQAEIWNAVGASTYKGQLQFAGGKASLQLNNCPPGMYVLQLLDEQGHRYAFKFTVN